MAPDRHVRQVVGEYLDMMEALQGMRREDPQGLESQLQDIDERIRREGDALARLGLIERRKRVRTQLSALREREIYEQAFVNVGAQYAEERGISFAAFREFGVPVAVLVRAGISPSG